MGRLILIFSILATVHVGYMAQLGNERLLMGILEGTVSYPPKDVLYWYASRVASFPEKEGFLHPLHIVYENCLKTAPFSSECQRVFDMVLSRGPNIDASSGLNYQLTMLYKAMLNCSPEGVEFLVSRGASPKTMPSEGPYSNTKPREFLSRVPECRKKEVIKKILDGEKVFGYRPSKELVEWTRSSIFK